MAPLHLPTLALAAALPAALPAALLVALLAAPGSTARSQPTQALPVEVAEVIATPMAPVMWVPGTVVSRNDARIAAEVAGRITRIAEPGDHFDRGEAIATLDSRVLELSLEEHRAEVGRLEALLRYQDQQVSRLVRLAEQDNASRTQLDQTRSERDATAMELVRARAARDRIAYDLERSVVRAPFPGQWVERHQQTGEFTGVGTVLGRLVNLRDKEVRARAPVTVAVFLREGMAVSVRGDGSGGTAELGRFKVRVVIPVGDEISRSIELRVPVPADGPLVGTAVRLAVPTDREQVVLAVPRDALVIRSGETSVQRVQEGAVRRTPVVVGIGRGDMIAVEGDLASGDRVVVRGAERLRDGQPVRILSERQYGAATDRAP